MGVGGVHARRASALRLHSSGVAALLSALVLQLAVLAADGHSRAADTLTVISGPTMGTTYSVKIDDPEVDRDALGLAINTVLERINDSMSTWRPDSELSRFNQSKSTDWFPVTVELTRVVVAAEAISNASDGAFDVTVGPLVNLWGFGPGGRTVAPPSEQQIARTMPLIGYRMLAVSTIPPALRKQKPGMYVDLSGIAKGYAVDAIAQLLDERNVRDYLVDIGGELRARGTRSDGTPWRVAIERPVPGTRTAQSIVELRDSAIATSGDYRNYVERDGKRYSHTIDPRTGRPITNALASVSVITDTAMRADAFATAILVLGPEEGYALAERETLAAQLIIKSEDGFEVRSTPKFEAILLR